MRQPHPFLVPPAIRPRHRVLWRGVMLALVLVALPAIVQAQTPAQRRAEADRLLDALRVAPSKAAAETLEDRIRQIWLNESTPAVTLLMSRGLREMKAANYSDAIEDFGDAIALDPTLAEAYHQRAIARWHAGDTPGTIADIEATLKQDPRHFNALQTLSRISEARDDWKGAYEAWQKVMEIDPKTPDGDDRLKELKRRALGEET